MRIFPLSVLIFGVAWFPVGLDAAPAYTVTEVAVGSLPGNSDDLFSVVGMNDSGEIIGTYDTDPNGEVGTFLYSNGVLTDMVGLPKAGGFTEASGINNLGQIVGISGARPFLYQNGVIEDIGETISPGPRVLSINDSGQIAAECIDNTTGGYHAFLFTGSARQDLDGLGGDTSYPTAINADGEVVGDVLIGSGNHGFLYSRGKMTDLDPKNGKVYPSSINSHHQIVGFMGPTVADRYANTARAFLFQGGRMIDLGHLKSRGSVATSISDSGVIVGFSNYSFSLDHAFIDEHLKMTDLNSLIPAHSGWVLTEAEAINGVGQIAGEGVYNGVHEVFLLTPIPTISLSGSTRITTRLSRITVRGKTTSAVTSVEYQIGSRPPQTATGTKNWHFAARLRPGKNHITIRAFTTGAKSAPVRLEVNRI